MSEAAQAATNPALEKSGAVAVLMVLALLPSGAVIGACVGGFVGNNFGNNMGDALGGLFGGFLLGAFAAVGLSVYGIRSWNDGQRMRTLAASVVSALLVVGATWLKVNLSGHW